MLSTGRPWAMVTGASSGLGVASAERLAAGGHDLVIVARRGDRLEQVAERLQRDGHTVETVAGGLADRATLAALEARVAEAPPPDLLVNNAGFGAYGAFVEADPDSSNARSRCISPRRSGWRAPRFRA